MMEGVSKSGGRSPLKYPNKAVFARTWKMVKKSKYLQLLAIPGMLYYIIFHYFPIYGIVVAFQDYSVVRGYFGSEWVGLENFRLFFNNPYLLTLLKNTLIINVLQVLWCFWPPILLALFLNEVTNRHFKKLVQTISYLPTFLSTVTVVSMLVLMLSPTTGAVNQIIKVLGAEPIYFMGSSSWFRTIYIASDIWKGVGFGAIIYLSSLTGINPELYESADMDGATRTQKMRYISIPGIKPTIILMLILSLGGLMNEGAEKVILMYNAMNYNVADILSSYIYRRGLENADYSYSAAVGLFNSLVNFVLLFTANNVCRKFSGESLW